MSTEDRFADFQSDLDDKKRKAEEGDQLKMAKKIIKEQQLRLERILKPKFQPLVIPDPIGCEKDSWFRIIISVMHGSQMDRADVGALLSDLQILKPRELFILGDYIECGGFLAEHHTWGYVAETAYNYDDDIHAGTWVLDRIQETVPEVEYTLGNHERRPEQWCVTQAVKAKSDKEFLLKQLQKAICVEHLLQLDKRGVKYVKQGQTEDGQFVPATIKRGKSHYTHTAFERGGANASVKHLTKFQANVAFGHSHTAEVRTMRVGATGETLIARNHGCLCLRQPLWRHTEPTGWTHGYGLEVCKADGRFLSLHIPILDGESLLTHLSSMLAVG